MAAPCAEPEPSTNPGCWGLSEMGASFSSCFSTVFRAQNPGCWGLSEMGARFSSCFSTAEAEESSPSTVVDVVAEVEAVTMVGAEGASTSGRSEYYSIRCEAMMRSRGKFSDDVAMGIEFSKSHCSEVVRVEVEPQSAEEEELNRENRKVLKQLKEEYPRLFDPNFGCDYVLGDMVAKGGQAEIYEVVDYPFYLLKVFERGTSLRDLQGQWPLPVLNERVRQCISYAGLLEDGRFAFLMGKCWGDLRKLIDQAMQEKNVDGVKGPPFPYKWKDYNRWTFYPVDFMLGIAEHMRDLHENGISHRDLKASNILLQNNFGVEMYIVTPRYERGIIVADFECSIGVLGTGFWRAPEILSTLPNVSTITNEEWKKADVYSFGMICFELVTGRIPFDGELKNTRADRQLVIEGKRPQLPSDLDNEVKDLIIKCWEPNPNSRPTFFEIVEMVETMPTRQCQFRLFGIGDKLPPQYRLATVEEVNEYPVALRRVMPRRQIVNLANGSVDGYLSGMYTRLEKQSDACHKVARLHH